MENSFDRSANAVDEKKAKLRKRNREAAQRSRLDLSDNIYFPSDNIIFEKSITRQII